MSECVFGLRSPSMKLKKYLSYIGNQFCHISHNFCQYTYMFTKLSCPLKFPLTVSIVFTSTKYEIRYILCIFPFALSMVIYVPFASVCDISIVLLAVSKWAFMHIVYKYELCAGK